MELNASDIERRPPQCPADVLPSPIAYRFRDRYQSLGKEAPMSDESHSGGLRVVTLGGGPGMYAVLTGLRRYTSQITAVVSMADNGGSSGRLRDEFGSLPPGDARRCLVALADEEDALLLRRL